MLVVEDDAASRTAMRYLLNYHGWQPTDVGTVAQGHALLGTLRPHALILDLMLPDGNGLELLRRIRAEQLPVRVAIVTGIGDPDVMAEAASLKPEILFRKPVTAQTLMQWLGPLDD